VEDDGTATYELSSGKSQNNIVLHFYIRNENFMFLVVLMDPCEIHEIGRISKVAEEA